MIESTTQLRYTGTNSRSESITLVKNESKKVKEYCYRGIFYCKVNGKRLDVQRYRY